MIEPELQIAAGKLTAEDISSALLGDKQKQELIANTLLVAAPFKIRDKIPARKAEVRNNTGHACNVCGYFRAKGVLARDMLLLKDACMLFEFSSDLLPLTLIYLPSGLALCWVFDKTKSLWAAIVLHSIMNAVAAVLIAGGM